MEQNPDLAKSMLFLLEGMIAGTQDVKIVNAPDSLKIYVQNVIERMGPQNIYTNAMAWDMLETLQKMHDTAKSLVCAGDLAQASLWYHKVWGVYDYCPLFRLDARAYDSLALIEPLSALYSVILNAGVTDGFLLIRGSSDEELGSPMATRHIEFIRTIIADIERLPKALTNLVLDKFRTNNIDKAAVWLTDVYHFKSHRCGDGLDYETQSMPTLVEYLSGFEEFRRDLAMMYACYSKIQVS